MIQEKKYDEALERAEKIYHSEFKPDEAAVLAEYLPMIFPELKDDNDEKIRLEIRNFIWGYPDKLPERDKWLAWFEKQSNKSVNIDVESMVSSYEQRLESQGGTKYTPLVNMCLTSFRHGVENVLEELNLKKLEKQDEQPIDKIEPNPAWSEKDKNLLNRLIGVLDGTNEEDYHEAWEETFLPWLKSLKERMQSQPKQCEQPIDKVEPNPEWSDEDEEMLTWLCRIIHSQRLDRAITLKEESELGEWIDKWLNHNPQPKQCEYLENYDEDDRIRRGIIRNLQFLMDKSEGFVKKDLHERITWLENQKNYIKLPNSAYTSNSDVIEFADKYSHTVWEKLMDNFKKIENYSIGCNDVSDLVLNAIINTYNWLEKQGEKKHIINVPSRDVILSIWDLGNEWKELTNGCISTEYGTQLDYIQKHWHESEYYLKEKQGEQQTDKIEPKFKVRDWCIDDEDGTIFQIVKVLDNTYTYKTNEGSEYSCTHYSLENDAHLWSINDAKDGDVLTTDNENCPFIYRTKTVFGNPVAYCGVRSDGLFISESPENHQWCLKDEVIPATKEQRDLLFEKMKEAGYEWNAEKKEVKKIEPKFKVGYWITDGNHTWKIVEVKLLDYILQSQDGNIVDDTISYVDEQFHSFTIEDAKDGDVLAFDNDTIVIFKDLYNSFTFHSYCHIEDGLFDVSKDDMPDWWEGKGFQPATKEQRDLLFEKMKEAGYEWRQEEKKLIKINEPKFKEGDYIMNNDITEDGKPEIFKIIKVCSSWYDVENVYDGRQTIITFSQDYTCHLWTIADTKDGDVLSFNDGHGNDCIELIKSIKGEKIEFWFCLTNGNSYEVFDGITPYTNFVSRECATPATKEQRDLLFEKMKEAGYEWRQKEKKLIKINESKFKIRDWITNGGANPCYVKSIFGDYYELCSCEGFEYAKHIKDVDYTYHLWTIADANDGDVFAVEPIDGYPSPFVAVYKEHGLDFFNSYCFIGFDGKFYEAEEGHSTEEIHPATKEQRELLFAKMKEAGYGWHNGKKECMKIEPKILSADDVLPYLGNNQVQDILEDMGMLDDNGRCPHTAEEIFKAGMEHAFNLNREAT